MQYTYVTSGYIYYFVTSLLFIYCQAAELGMERKVISVSSLLNCYGIASGTDLSEDESRLFATTWL